MKKLHIFYIFAIALSLFFIPAPANAQNTVQCGQTIQGEFSYDEEIHEYSIELDENFVLYAIGLVDELDREVMKIDVQIFAPNGRQLADPWYADLIYAVTSIPDTGTYTILAQGYSNYGGGYTLYVSCIDTTGSVITDSRYVQELKCGEIVESYFEIDQEAHSYFVNLSSGDKIIVTGEVKQGYEETINLDVRIFAPNGRQLVDPWYGDRIEASTTIVDSGTHLVLAEGYGNYGGKYKLYVKCILSNGTIVQPGDVSSDSVTDKTAGEDNLPAPDNFSNIITLPLPDNGSTNGIIKPDDTDVLGFAFEASADDVLDLTYTRSSGNLNLGLVVLSAKNDEIIFQASLITTKTLSTQIVLPSSGEYIIGVFRIDPLPSGAKPTAFQLQGILNP